LRVAPSGNEPLERRVRALCTTGDYSAAAELTVRGYGPEILGFLTATHGSESEADEVFADLSETLWRKLSTFAWDSSLRTWSYAVARNVSRTYRRDAGRRRRREAAAPESLLDQVAAAVRTETRSFLRTSARPKALALRDQLPEGDRALLVLRVDRRLEWGEIARILLDEEEGGAEAADAVVLAREAARLRKRFQLVKSRLRAQLAREN
jgi:RNA polymerase sigma-70 factor (ECF subfamily)